MMTILLIIAIILIMMFPWLIPLFILLGVIIYFIKEAYKKSNYGKKQTIEKNKKIIKQAKELQERMNSCGVFPTYSVTNGISTIYFDENNRKIYLKCIDNVLNKSFKELALNIDSIISYGTNIKKDSNIQYTMGTYFTGKFKVNEDINTIWFSMQLNSIETPYIYFLCSGYSVGIPEANQFANKIIGALDYMKNNKITKQKPLLNIVPDLETEIIDDAVNNIDDKIKKENIKNDIVDEIKTEDIKSDIDDEVKTEDIKSDIVDEVKTEDIKNNIVNEIKKQDMLKIKTDENKLLKQQLETEQQKVRKLQDKLNRKKTKQIDKVKKSISTIINNIFNVINYGIAIFLYFGGIVCLSENKIYYSIGYIIMGTPFLPFIYKKIWKNKRVSKTKRIVIRIIFIIVGITLGALFLSN